MSANLAMLALAKNLGFSMKAMKEDPTLLLAKKSLV